MTVVRWTPEEWATLFDSLLADHISCHARNLISEIYIRQLRLLRSGRCRNMNSLYSSSGAIREAYTTYVEKSKTALLEKANTAPEKTEVPSGPLLDGFLRSLIRQELLAHEVRIELLLRNATGALRQAVQSQLNTFAHQLIDFWDAPVNGATPGPSVSDGRPSPTKKVVVYGLIAKKGHELRENLQEALPGFSLSNLLIFDQRASTRQIAVISCDVLVICKDYISHSAQASLEKTLAKRVLIASGSISALQSKIQAALLAG